MHVLLSDTNDREVTLELARKLSTRYIPVIEEPEARDVQFSIATDMQRNGDFNVTLKITNTSSASRTVEVRMSAISCRYTGISNAELKDAHTTDVLEPNAGKENKCLTEIVFIQFYEPTIYIKQSRKVFRKLSLFS